uniref:Uncharacterized protein n=1 Tax=Strigamia maritima TaxID=126957 RepID=T1JBJ1_STRMM
MLNKSLHNLLITRPSLKFLKIDKVRWASTFTRENSPDLAENGEVGSGDHNSSV